MVNETHTFSLLRLFLFTVVNLSLSFQSDMTESPRSLVTTFQCLIRGQEAMERARQR